MLMRDNGNGLVGVEYDEWEDGGGRVHGVPCT